MDVIEEIIRRAKLIYEVGIFNENRTILNFICLIMFVCCDMLMPTRTGIMYLVYI